MYINDLPNCSNALAFRIFADDTNVFASARNLKDLEEIVNSELKKVKIWCDVNRLSINFTKTNFMIIKSSKKKDDQVNIKIESADGTINVLQRKQKIKYQPRELTIGRSFYAPMPRLYKNLNEQLTYVLSFAISKCSFFRSEYSRRQSAD